MPVLLGSWGWGFFAIFLLLLATPSPAAIRRGKSNPRAGEARAALIPASSNFQADDTREASPIWPRLNPTLALQRMRGRAYYAIAMKPSESTRKRLFQVALGMGDEELSSLPFPHPRFILAIIVAIVPVESTFLRLNVELAAITESRISKVQILIQSP